MFRIPEAFGHEEPLNDYTFDTNFPKVINFQFVDKGTNVKKKNSWTQIVTHLSSLLLAFPMD